MRKRTSQSREQPPAIFLLFTVVIVGGLLFLFFKFQLGPFFSGPTGDMGADDRGAQEDGFEGRKNIYDRNFEEFSVSFRRSSLYARPLELEDPAVAAKQIAAVLEVDEKKLLSSLKSERSFVWLGRNISWAKAEGIVNLNMRGVYRLDQEHRFYPGGELASHVIGFMQDEQGLAGVESFYDNILQGGGVYDHTLAEAGLSEDIASGKLGVHLILTLDVRVQSLLEKDLQQLADVAGAKAASAMVMIPDSGEILGLANVPSYDPNRFWDYGAEERRNRAIVDEVDLGGLERLFHNAAALDQQLLVRSETNEAVKDSNRETSGSLAPWVWLREGVYASPEVLAIADYGLDPGQFSDFAYKIGLIGNEVDLPDEVSLPDLRGLDKRIEAKPQQEGAVPPAVEPQSGAGQAGGLRTNVASLLTAFCRVVNGGKPMTPHVLSAVWDEKKVWDLNVRLKEGRGTIKPGASEAIVQDLTRKATRSAGDVLIFESLLERRVLGNREQSADAVAPQTPPKKQFDQILLGMIGTDGAEVALVITLTDCHTDTDEESQARKVAKNLLPKARKYFAMKQDVPSGAEISAREDSFYLKWQKLEMKSKTQAPVPQDYQQAAMPKVTGYSLRRALQVLQPYGLRIQISGSGRVAAQHPTAGASLKGVDQCTLELRDR